MQKQQQPTTIQSKHKRKTFRKLSIKGAKWHLSWILVWKTVDPEQELLTLNVRGFVVIVVEWQPESNIIFCSFIALLLIDKPPHLMMSSAYCPVNIIARIITKWYYLKLLPILFGESIWKELHRCSFKNLFRFKPHTHVSGNKGKLQLLAWTGNHPTKLSSTWKLKYELLTI